MLDAVLSSRRTAARPAAALAGFSRGQQEFALHWANVIAKTNSEMAYQFVACAPAAFERLNLDRVQDWIIRAMDVYDRQGLYPGSAALRDVDGFVEEAGRRAHAVAFDEVAGVLEGYLKGLSGRDLKLETGDATHTDTERVCVPRCVDEFADRELNFRLYKAIVAHLWAQTRFGTFRSIASLPRLSEDMSRFDDPALATRLFNALETIRLDACIARELKGLGRDMRELQEHVASVRYPEAWLPHVRALQSVDASVADSRRALSALYAGSELPPSLCYQGELLLERAEAVADARTARDREALGETLASLAEELRTGADESADPGSERTVQFELRPPATVTEPQASQLELLLDGEPVTPPEQLTQLVASLLQDMDRIPQEYLVAAADRGRRPDAAARGAEDAWKGGQREEGALLYDEWDYRRQHYRKNWCVLREIDMQPSQDGFVERTLEKYAGLVGEIRKTFEALRGEDKLLRKQADGDDVDFDAVVEARADARSGLEMSDRLFTKRRKVERDMAVVFMVDVSGSTKGWINDAERESLVLLCEALDVLGDRYAIYGFSGMTRKRCELYRVKRIDEPYSASVRARIAAMAPKDYTRMGVTIRHLTRVLIDIEARTKLLITLSDGKPDDYDGYRGEYGIEDTRQSLIEAKHAGIHPFCITIDSQAHEYLPHMYGAVNYTVIDDVRRLPLRVSDIYRRLTT